MLNLNIMITQELIISETASAWESFVEALRGGEHISFSAFCRNAQVNSTGFRRWLYVQSDGISLNVPPFINQVPVFKVSLLHGC